MFVKTHRNGCEKGAAIVEFAFLMVFLLLLTMGITEIGRAFWYYSAMQKAARDGARCLSLQPWAAGQESKCIDLVWQSANSAGVVNHVGSAAVALNAGNVRIDCGGGSCSWGSGARPEYVRVHIDGFNMGWIWSFGTPLPDAGGNSGINVQAAMPYMN
ncbi:MAG: hypothetical protein C3F18_06585 [Nitrosomonadales bacterium]|nr:MAG: hypothetical protein C3F18_06585 [Nitrosomonadales bacterium]